MTAIAGLSECDISLEENKIRATRTLQDLLDVSKKLFLRHRIDHAVLFSLPSSTWSMLLPLLPLDAELSAVTAQAVRLNVHPAAAVCQQSIGPKTYSVLSTKLAREPIVEQLLAAFRKIGMRHVYEVPLVSSRDEPFVLEIARSGGPISDEELLGLQTIARAITEKLPAFMLGKNECSGSKTPDRQ